MIVSGIYPAGSTRLDAFHAQFPNRSTVTSLDADDWSGAFDLIGQLYRGEFETGCVAKPLDLDPDTAGDQLDCTMTP